MRECKNWQDTKKRDGITNQIDIKIQYSILKFVKENFISIISLCISCMTLVIYIRANNISQFNTDMQYKLNLANLNMNVSEDDGIMSCKIVNSGGNIKEATLIPHMYLELRCCPEYTTITKSYAIEISDFFGKKVLDGVYWTTEKIYNIEENGWTVNIDQDRMNQALSLLFKIQNNVELPYITSELSLCFEIKYIDFVGNSHIEWYYADYFNGGLLQYINKDFVLPLEQYSNAKRIHMDEILENDNVIAIISKEYEKVLSIN